MTDSPGVGASRLLRDYLYVDVDKVKSIAGQLDSGVPEEARLTAKDLSRTSIGWRTFFSYTPESSEESYVQRSMLDSLFPELEELLEQDWLKDISEEFAATESDPVETLREIRPEGSLFRLTADGYLFDTRYLASLFANFSITMNGFQNFEKAQEELVQSMAKQAEGAPPKKAPPKKRPDLAPAVEDVVALEEAIEEFAPQHGMSPNLLRGMVHTARGAFTPGLQLFMANQDGLDTMSLVAHLAENGRYLAADPRAIAARYGFQPQRWTIVATVGHYSEPPENAAIASATTALENQQSEGFRRELFVRTINNSIRDMGGSGLIDLPQHPGMAAIPLAVYRAVEGGPPLGNVSAIEP